MQAVLPDDIKVSFEFDQSPTVTNAMTSLAAEGVLGAILTGLMVLVFLRDWRSVIVVVLNIPLALCGAIVALWLTGQTVNLMTLGGLALAIGILVDEATVEIENIHTKMGTPRTSRERSARATSTRPSRGCWRCSASSRSSSRRSSCKGRPRPSSSRSRWPSASRWSRPTCSPARSSPSSRSGCSGTNGRAPRDKLRGVRSSTGSATATAGAQAASFGCAGSSSRAILRRPCSSAYGVGRQLGLEIFPRVDAGRFQLRIKRTGRDADREDRDDRQGSAGGRCATEVGDDGVAISVGYVGLIPSSYPINAIYQWTAGPEEAVVAGGRFATRRAWTSRPSSDGSATSSSPAPNVQFSFEPADIVSDVMSFGSPTPIEVAVSGPNYAESGPTPRRFAPSLAKVPTLRDLQYAQALDYPTVSVDIDRERAGLSGVTAEEVARSLVTATSSSRFIVPNYWPDPKTGIGYQVQVEVPTAIMDSMKQVETIPVQRPGGPSLLLRDVAKVQRGSMPGEYDRYNMKRSISLTANIVGEDLGRPRAASPKPCARAGSPQGGQRRDPRPGGPDARDAHRPGDRPRHVHRGDLAPADRELPVGPARPGHRLDGPRRDRRRRHRLVAHRDRPSTSSHSWGRSWPWAWRSPTPFCSSPSPNDADARTPPQRPTRRSAAPRACCGPFS